MISFIFLLQIKGERAPLGKGRSLSLVNFQCEIASHKGINLISLQILGIYTCLKKVECEQRENFRKKNMFG